MAAAGGRRRAKRSEVSKRLNQAKSEVAGLKKELEALHAENDNVLHGVWASLGTASKGSQAVTFSLARRLAGHFGKVKALHWGSSSKLASASQDGKLFVWDAANDARTLSIKLESAWVMACAMERSEQRIIACGGLDNTCSLYDCEVTAPTISKPSAEFTGHEGYLSKVTFIDKHHILTASGDSTCCIWDASSGQRLHKFEDHAADVASVDLQPGNTNVFASGSCDGTVRVWDVRTGRCTHCFLGHDSDVNDVAFFPSGHVVCSGSDDSTCRMFDMRARCTINLLSHEAKTGSIVSSIGVSHSGAFLIAGYEDCTACAWDVTSKDMRFHQLGSGRDTGGHRGQAGHTGRVECLGVSTDGQAIATGGWDNMVLVWSGAKSSGK